VGVTEQWRRVTGVTARAACEPHPPQDGIANPGK